MPTFIKTRCFITSRGFDSDKDDAKVNSALVQLQESGAKIVDITLRVGGLDSGAIAVYMIVYEAPSPV